MTAEQQRIAIVREMGWTDAHVKAWREVAELKREYRKLPKKASFSGWAIADKIAKAERDPNYLGDIPNYPADLNACAEFEKTLSDREWEKYVALLSQGITRTWWEGARAVCRAKAEQRCEAFLRTKGIIQ